MYISLSAVFLIFIITVTGVIAFCQDTNTSSNMFSISQRDTAVTIWLIAAIIVVLIYGGIFWW